MLRTAGQTKRDNQSADEQMLMATTLRDMNLSKFVAHDVPLFLSLLQDIFPRALLPQGSANGNPKFHTAVSTAIQTRNLVDCPSWRLKVIQLHETTLVRHGIMLVGPSGGGKSTVINVVQDALTATTSLLHKRVRLNPKAIRAEEMFGETDRLSGAQFLRVRVLVFSQVARR